MVSYFNIACTGNIIDFSLYIVLYIECDAAIVSSGRLKAGASIADSCPDLLFLPVILH
jgi:hypothetical protein